MKNKTKYNTISFQCQILKRSLTLQMVKQIKQNEKKKTNQLTNKTKLKCDRNRLSLSQMKTESNYEIKPKNEQQKKTKMILRTK